MAENLIQFVWQVNKDGYVITRGQLVSVPDAEGTWRFREYRPLRDVPELYRKFAALPVDDEEAVLSFVNHYGLLVLDRNSEIPFSCSLDLFKSEAQAMWRAVELFKNAKGLLDLAAAELRERQNAQGVAQNLAKLAALGPQPDAIMMLADNPRPVDLAYAEIMGIINQRLKNRVAPKLYYSLEGQRIADVHFSVVPVDLLGAMWLQLAQMVGRSQLHLRCVVCGAWFLERPQAGKRPAKGYCSDACKQRAYRQRKLNPDVVKAVSN